MTTRFPKVTLFSVLSVSLIGFNTFASAQQSQQDPQNTPAQQTQQQDSNPTNNTSTTPDPNALDRFKKIDQVEIILTEAKVARAAPADAEKKKPEPKPADGETKDAADKKPDAAPPKPEEPEKKPEEPPDDPSLVQSGERDRAFDAIGHLGELMRTAMRSSPDHAVTLAEEMSFLKGYLDLCELRFGRQFRFCLSMPEELGSRRVPALIVQPLIENSIRHGMESGRPLNVDIRVYARGNEVVIEVEDDGRGVDAGQGAALPAGHGLANVAERLRLSFGEGGRLILRPRSPRGTVARLVIGG